MGGALLVGIVITGLVVYLVSDSLEVELIERGKAIAKTLAEQMERPLVGDDDVDMQNMVDISSNFEAVSYVFVEDASNAIVSQRFKRGSYQDLVEQAKRPDKDSEFSIRLTVNAGEENYEIAAPIGEGVLGSAHVGMSKAYIDGIAGTTASIVGGVLVIAILVSMLVALVLSNRITKQILYLTESADKISLGDLENKVELSARDEIGDLSDSIERLRESLKAAIDRLKKKRIA